ncbi:HNH endonuclease [Streptomyces sp. NPDC017993]|uniref:HNH endonuclease n=1 Tax=Streptomyces sp. NPDC017993 TaxID=3365027 RepID=UPI0037A546B2
MGLGDVTRSGVLAAVGEIRHLGRDAFRRRHGFGRATAYELLIDGDRYDSKAIAGVGHLYATDVLLRSDDFSGGSHEVERRLRALGFTVTGASSMDAPEPYAAQLVLQPRGGAHVQGPKNFKKSVRTGVPITEIETVLGKQQTSVLSDLYADGVARLWGATPAKRVNDPKAKALRDRRVGDDVLFYADKGFIARARIYHLFHSPAVARAVWGVDQDGSTWEHIMALGDIEEFSEVVPAAPILQSLNVPAPLRCLTLRSAEDYRRIAYMFPERRSSLPLQPSCERLSASKSMTALDVLERIGGLNTHRNSGGGTPSRHQPLALLWTISRVAAGKPRLASWSRFRAEVGPLLAEFGLPSSKVTPEYPFWHLQGSGLWEVHGVPEDAGAMPRTGVFDTVQPVAGLTCEAAEIIKDPVARLDVIAKLCRTYLEGVDRHALFGRVELSGYETADGVLTGNAEATEQAVDVERASGPAERRESKSSRLVRDAALARRVKELHSNTCQVCEVRLQYKRSPYSEAAHIRGLGSPHDGPDELPNLLCLCPNHHTLFDGLEIYIDVDGIVQRTHGGGPLGPLRRRPGHPLDEEHLRYHRMLCALSV